MALATNLGFPRIGPNRELKKALESFWAGKSTESDLRRVGADVRRWQWSTQTAAGLRHVPVNDFSYYDHVLDTAVSLGLTPDRAASVAGAPGTLQRYFALARGVASAGGGVPALEMTKWFDTNYHYLVPELTPASGGPGASSGGAGATNFSKPLDELGEARAQGVPARPVIVGPVTLLLLSKGRGVEPLSLLDRVLPAYRELLTKLAEAGAEWVQIDEPALVTDLDFAAREAFTRAYRGLRTSAGPRLLLTTYFGALGNNLPLAVNADVDGLHIDLVRAPGQLDPVLSALPRGRVLSLGVVDGRNVWRTNLDRALQLVRRAADRVGSERLFVAPSCSLLHSPADLEPEALDARPSLDPEVRSWLAFAKQKVQEVVTLTRAINEGPEAVAEALEASRAAVESRRASARVRDPGVRSRLASLAPGMYRRSSPYAQRAATQAEVLKLPPLPTTTIGSFPQTPEIRAARASFSSGAIDRAQYDRFLQREIEHCVREQEQTGLDVLVHGESERNDMVEYFGERLSGFAFSRHAWVQSYGSRCVKPPIIFGDVRRPAPMTVAWSAYAQSLTKRPMKGMLTGPVTILQWSFVRDDQPREETCRQIALAIRDEVTDLESAGLRVVQIDEPALREGLPLRRDEGPAYLRWAVDSFRLATAGARDGTQIHTHMCYSEFNTIIDSIAALDADVISIEASRSDMELLDAFERFRYPAEIGPGVYDIHSPRVPTVEEMVSLLRAALRVIDARQLWVNPDCGLKTRGWPEVKASLANMVEAAKRVRAELKANGGRLPDALVEAAPSGAGATA